MPPQTTQTSTPVPEKLTEESTSKIQTRQVNFFYLDMSMLLVPY